MIKIFIALISLMLTASTPVIASDVMPYYSKNLHTRTYGFYQVGKFITLHEEPDENSKIVKTISWTKEKLMPENLTYDDVFSVFIESKELALMAVEDETEDWVKLIYDNKTNQSGWLKKDDPYKFMTWLNLYNAYGKKYGLKILKDTPDEMLVLRAKTEDNSQIVARINHPQFIKLNVIRGNWALVSVVDIDKTPKTGYIRWRSDDGIKYLFPDIK
ncbi:hypothetical protein IKU74_07360 [bacterium]|nr:hypothetical protein [bacterium]